MEQIISKNHIVLRDAVDSWQDAIRISAQPLIDGHYIEPRYVDAIFESTETHGPYYVLAPEIAMPHAGLSDGVVAQQMSLLVLKHPIKFSEDSFDVRLVFTLAAKDGHSHLKMLQQLSEIFVDDALIQEIIHCDDPIKIAEMINT